MNVYDFKYYPAKITKNPDNTYTIQLRNWDGAFSQANSYEEAKETAKVLLLDVINSLLEDKMTVEKGVSAEEDDYVIELSLDTALKIVLLNYMITDRYRKSDIAKGLGVPPQRMTTFLSLRKSTNLDFLEKAFAFINRPMNISI